MNPAAPVTSTRFGSSVMIPLYYQLRDMELLLVTLPVLVVFLVFRQRLVRGLTGGAVEG